jgi:HAL2 family 3'(2'),5'-bisphosphate nucleotidase
MTPSQSEPALHSPLLAAAREAVLLAAAACRRAQSEIESVRAATKDDKSPVTVADFAAQAVVAASLADQLGPRFTAAGLVAEEDPAFLREPGRAAYLEATVEVARSVRPELSAERLLAALEAGGKPSGGAGAFFTLDPIDGTKGFLRGQQYAIALAFVEAGRPVAGALACPNLALDPTAPVDVADPEGSLYVAVRGGGTWELACVRDSRRAPRALPRAASLDRAVRVTASVEKAHSSVSDTDRVIAAVRADPAVVRLDSSAKYAVVARGQADAYLRLPTRADYVERIWDHAAGVIVAEEAGVRVTDVTGAELDFAHGRGLERNRGVVVAHPDAHPLLIAAIAELGIR